MNKDPFGGAGKTSIHLSQEESTNLAAAVNKLHKMSSTSLNTFLNPKNSSITDFPAFKAAVEKRYQLYESLCSNLHKISQKLLRQQTEDQSSPLGGGSGGERQPERQRLSHQAQIGLQYFQRLSQPHSEIFDLVKFKVGRVFEAVREYLDRLNSDPLQVDLKKSTIDHYTSELERIVERAEYEDGNEQGEDDGARISQVYQNLGIIQGILSGSLLPQKPYLDASKHTPNTLTYSPNTSMHTLNPQKIPKTQKVHQGLDTAQKPLMHLNPLVSSSYSWQISDPYVSGTIPPANPVTLDKSTQTDPQEDISIMRASSTQKMAKTVSKSDYLTGIGGFNRNKGIKIHLSCQDKISNYCPGGAHMRFICFGSKDSYAYSQLNFGFDIDKVKTGKNGQNRKISNLCKIVNQNVREVVYAAGYYYFHDTRLQKICRLASSGEGKIQLFLDVEIQDLEKNSIQSVLKASEGGSGSILGLRISKSKLYHITLQSKVLYIKQAILSDSNEYFESIVLFILIGSHQLACVCSRFNHFSGALLGWVLYLFEERGSDQQQSMAKEFSMLFSGEDSQEPFYLAGSQAEKRIAVLMRDGATKFASSIRVYGIEGQKYQRRLVEKAKIDLSSEKLMFYHSICFLPGVDSSDFICGYSSVPRPTFFVYSYDVYSHEVKVVKRLEVSGKGDCSILRLERFGGMVYGLMKNGCVLKVDFDY